MEQIIYKKDRSSKFSKYVEYFSTSLDLKLGMPIPNLLKWNYVKYGHSPMGRIKLHPSSKLNLTYRLLFYIRK